MNAPEITRLALYMLAGVTAAIIAVLAYLAGDTATVTVALAWFATNVLAGANVKRSTSNPDHAA